MSILESVALYKPDTIRHHRLAAVEEKLEVERDILYLKIDRLESDNAELIRQQAQLESSLKQAATIIDTLEMNLQEQKSEKFEWVSHRTDAYPILIISRTG